MDASATDPQLPPGAYRGLWLGAGAFTVAASLLAIFVYVAYAWELVRYPWDWSPDEGLYLDYARRLLNAPASLYNDRGVPLPAMYGPLQPALLAPAVRMAHPLAAARVLTLLCTLFGAIALGALIRRRANLLWATAGAALYLAIFDISSWFTLVRVDAPLVTLWLWSAVLLLPEELRAGADRLSRARIAGGTAILLAAALAKPTAVVHGLPLVLGWFWVDRRSAWRLTVTMVVSGLAIVALLQMLTGGDFLSTNLLWRLHRSESGLLTKILTDFTLRTWPLLLLALVAGIAARLAKVHPLRDPVWLLLLGGLLILPMSNKGGACWNYLLPLYAALVVAAARWAARASATGGAWSALGPAGMAGLALVLAATQSFPLPTEFDEAASRTLYDFTQAVHRKVGGPFLVSSPDLVYFLAGQTTEIEGTSFKELAQGNAPGVRDVLTRLEQGRYTLVVETWSLPEEPEWQNALHRNYRPLGACRIGTYFTGYDSRLYARRDLPIAFTPPPGVRCLALPRSQ